MRAKSARIRRRLSPHLVLLAALGCGASGAATNRQPLPDPLVGVSGEELFARGQRSMRFGDHVRAEQYFVSAIERGVPEGQVLPLLLRTCIESQRFSIALRYAEPYLREHPSDWGLRFLKATLHLGLGDPPAARRELEQVLRDAPDEAAPHYALGMLHLESEAPRQALGHLERYLELAPEGVHAEEVRAALARDRPSQIERLDIPPDEVPLPSPEAGPPARDEGGDAG